MGVFDKIKKKKEQAAGKKAAAGIGLTTSADPETGSGVVNPPERPTTSKAKELQDKEQAVKVAQKKRTPNKEEPKKAPKKAEKKTKKEPETPAGNHTAHMEVLKAEGKDVPAWLKAKVEEFENSGRRVVGILKGTKGIHTFVYVTQ